MCWRYPISIAMDQNLLSFERRARRTVTLSSLTAGSYCQQRSDVQNRTGRLRPWLRVSLMQICVLTRRGRRYAVSWAPAASFLPFGTLPIEQQEMSLLLRVIRGKLPKRGVRQGRSLAWPSSVRPSVSSFYYFYSTVSVRPSVRPRPPFR